MNDQAVISRGKKSGWMNSLVSILMTILMAVNTITPLLVGLGVLGYFINAAEETRKEMAECDDTVHRESIEDTNRWRYAAGKQGEIIDFFNEHPEMISRVRTVSDYIAVVNYKNFFDPEAQAAVNASTEFVKEQSQKIIDLFHDLPDVASMITSRREYYQWLFITDLFVSPYRYERGAGWWNISSEEYYHHVAQLGESRIIRGSSGRFHGDITGMF